MCTSIDEVVEVTTHELHEDDIAFDGHFVEMVPAEPAPPLSVEERAAAVLRRKKRRLAMAAALVAKNRERTAAVSPTRDWPEISDSEAELSDPDFWGRLAGSDTEWQSEEPVERAPSHRKQPRLDPVMQARRAWR